MTRLLGIRPNAYGEYKDESYDHIKSIGLTYLEVEMPSIEEEKDMLKVLDKSGLRILTVCIRHMLHLDNYLGLWQQDLTRARELGARTVFTSLKSESMEKKLVYSRLKEIGDIASSLGLKVCLETHPDLASNSDQMLETMNSVDNKGIRINFDPANIHFYNRDKDAIQELEKVKGFVGSVHLKDTDGIHDSSYYPALGDGIIDFSGFRNIMDEMDFCGPYVIELEGKASPNGTREDYSNRVTKSVEYLKKLHYF